MKTSVSLFSKSVTLAASVLLYGQSVIAQTSLTEETLDIIPTGEEESFGLKNGSVIAVPIPFSNPTVGNGLAVGGGWLFTSDPASNSSSIGLGGFRTDNGSNGLAFGANLNSNANRYRFSFLAGSVDLRYDFEAGSFDFPLKQSGELYKIDAAYGLSEDFSLGIGLQYAKTSLATNFGGTLPPEVSASLDLDVFKFGVISDWDRRDSDIYPTSGTRLTLDVFRGEVRGDVTRDYNKAVVQGSLYRPVSENGVFAVSATLCGASESAPFFDACSIGLTDGMRGFSVTKYIGDSLISAQTEYRGRIGQSRFGYAAFAGVGSVGGTETSASGIHYAAGIGLRFRLSKSFPVDFSIDATVNSDDETLYYVYVGQSF